MSEEPAEQGISIRLLRDLERNVAYELYGWFTKPDEPTAPAPKDDVK